MISPKAIDVMPVVSDAPTSPASSNDADQSESMVESAPLSPRIRSIGTVRSRKTVERMLHLSPEGKGVKKFKPAPLSGTGMKLVDITKIAEKLSKVAVKDDALKRLHRVLYGSEGTATTRKKEIRLWNGTVNHETKASMISGLSGAKSVQILKDIASILSLATGGDRATLEGRICDFLLKPIGSTDPVKKSKKSSKKSKSSKKIRGKKSESSSSAFSSFLKKRMSEVLAQADGSMTARDVTELLTLEWKNMTQEERNEFKPASSTKLVEVQKVIKKDVKHEAKSEETGEDGSESESGDNSSDEDSSGSSSSSGSSDDSSSSSDSSPDDQE